MEELVPKGHMYVRSWRHTRLGGRTESIAVCPDCLTVVEPVRRRRSRAGTHGDDFYEHSHQLVFLELVQSNSGNRSHYVVGDVDLDLKLLLSHIGERWSFYGADVSDVKEYAKKLLALEKKEVSG
jgi:hypothetical protein